VHIDEAVTAIRNGLVVAYPTEAVYGLGCDPNNADALQALLSLKSRAAHKGFIVIAANRRQLDSIMAVLPTHDEQTLAATWPGPCTWIVPAAKNLPPLLTGDRSTIAVRVSAHPVAQALCIACDHALVSTSANPSGDEPLRCASDVQACFGNAIAGVVDGALGNESSVTRIMELATGKRLR